jgi:hypothetical protein
VWWAWVEKAGLTYLNADTGKRINVSLGGPPGTAHSELLGKQKFGRHIARSACVVSCASSVMTSFRKASKTKICKNRMEVVVDENVGLIICHKLITRSTREI